MGKFDNSVEIRKIFGKFLPLLFTIICTFTESNIVVFGNYGFPFVLGQSY